MTTEAPAGKNLLGLSRMGVIVMPAAPGFYAHPRGIDDLVDFIAARVLDHMEIGHGVGYRWSGEEESGRD